MYLEHLAYFIEVAKNGSVNKAAQKLFISQPSLRQAIISLENQFGYPLVTTTNHGITLTPLGEKIFAEYPLVQHYIDGWFKTAQELNSQKSIRFAALGLPSTFMLDTLIAIFESEFPNVSFDIIQCNAVEALEHLKNHTCDLAMVYAVEDDFSKALERAKLTDVDVTLLFRDQFLCFFHPENVLAKQECISLADLNEMTYITFSHKEMLPNAQYDHAIQNMLTGKKHSLNSYESVVRLLKSSPKHFSIFGQLFYLAYANEHILGYMICIV